eukprot:6461187-Alexandrium_andersonii.AAC.1
MPWLLAPRRAVAITNQEKAQAHAQRSNEDLHSAPAVDVSHATGPPDAEDTAGSPPSAPARP